MALARTAVAVVAAGTMAMLSARAGTPGAPDVQGSPDASTPAPPPLTGPALQSAVDALLERGADGDAWRPLGPSAVPVLEQIARDGRAPPPRREQAIRSLGALEVPEAAAPLRAITADARAPDGERCRAAFALAQQQGPAAVADLEPLLQEPGDALRAGAARGLGQAGGDDAKKALEDRLELEETPVVREEIQRTLTLMQP